jgi:hypothetical protein
MMSPPMRISPSWKMPSLLMSATDSRAGSTRAQLAIQAGNWSKGVPTSTLNTSYFTSTASAGAVKYSRKMKNSDHVTEARASFTEGVV